MSEALEPRVEYSASAAASERDAITMSPTLEGPERWHDYSVERGNESSLTSVGVSHCHAQTNWNLHGLWRG